MQLRLEHRSTALIRASGVISAIFALLGAALIDGGPENSEYLMFIGGRAEFALGVLAGYILTVAKIILADRSRKKILGLSGAESKARESAGYLWRFALTAVFLFITASVPQTGFLGAVLGVLSFWLAEVFTPCAESPGAKKDPAA